MNLHDLYIESLNEHGFTADAAQLESVAALERIRSELLATSHSRFPRPGFLRSLRSTNQPAPVPGAYLWGGVGRGKTFVMDLFFDSLPFENKLRQHFHRMMYYVHKQLKQLDNQTDPLETVARNLAQRARVICFDEFFVADIADAMILGRLLDALFRHGVTLIATSNIPPDELYRDGLQRQQFLPAIELLKLKTEIIEVNGDTDYRLRVLEQAEIYHSPLDDEATHNLVSYFECIAPEPGTKNQSIEVHGRRIPLRRRADGIAWFDFTALCDGPRSQNDYIEIARSFQTIILSDLPILDSLKENEARRFIALVDEFYDRRVKLIIAAAAPIAEIYSGRHLNREFERTQSRLWEMQSHDYLAAPHRP
ncbi:MAG: cell division protein ZapE [Gammaproteobacteria bacterium]|jgi:cell division protein ZapE|nr:cell division protein ZapE [Chromatiales bacterium]MDP6675743.1 cell division protein ZapE [Gammaproteobacteria bacterium]